VITAERLGKRDNCFVQSSLASTDVESILPDAATKKSRFRTTRQKVTTIKKGGDNLGTTTDNHRTFPCMIHDWMAHKHRCGISTVAFGCT
jgi:hypothetical protein